MKFETKIMLVFTSILVIGFSAINLVSLLFYKVLLEESLYREGVMHRNLSAFIKSYRFPDYIKVSDKKAEGFVEVGTTGGKFVLVKEDYIKDKLLRFISLLFLWEIALVLSLNYILYLSIIRYIKKKREFERLFEVITLSLSHKMGNFLSTQKLNLQMLKDTYGENPYLNRLVSAHSMMEKDLKNTTKALKRLSTLEERKERINLLEVVKEILGTLEETGRRKRVLLSGREVYVYTNRVKLENMLFPLIENAFFYSKSFVHVKLCSKEGATLIIRNDIGPLSKGSGLGETLARYLLETEGGRFYKRFNKSFYTVFVKFA